MRVFQIQPRGHGSSTHGERPSHAGPGLTIVEMINAAALGEIKGLYFMGENPAMSDPDAGHVREALCRLDHLVVQDIFLTETAALADVVLPTTSMFEKWGSFTNTNRQVQLSRPVLPAPGDARQDLWVLQEMARRLGLKWSYVHPSEIWDEVRSLWPAVRGIRWEPARTRRLVPISLHFRGGPRRGRAVWRTVRYARRPG